MKKLKKGKLERNLAIFLSTCVFAGSGFYFANTVQAAPAIGSGTGTNSVIAGENVTASGEKAIAVGANSEASGENAIVVGDNNKANGGYAIAVGRSNTASGAFSSAFGDTNTASEQNASAFGTNNTAGGRNASAFGYYNKANGFDSSAFGAGNDARETYASAFGSYNTASAGYASAIGVINTASGSYANAFGSYNTASGMAANAFGYGNTASGMYASAVGFSNKASSKNASAFGYSNTANEMNANAFGYDNAVLAANSTAVGTANYIAGTAGNANAFGYLNMVEAANSTAVGNSNHIASSATDSFAFGSNIEMTLKDSVALGSGSVAAAINNVKGNSSYTKWAGVDDVVGVVSVGRSGGTRQIQNVAAGRVSANSTDAVNGSQLYEVAQKAAQQTTVSSSGDSNVVVTPTTNGSGGSDYEVKLGDKLDVGGNGTAVIDGTGDGKITVGTGGKVVLDGSDGSVKAGGVTINKNDEGTVNGLTNTTWDPDHITSGQAATEDQLKAIHDTASNAATEAAKHSTVSAGDNNLIVDNSGTNGTGGIDHQVRLNDVIEIGSGANKVTVDGNNGKVGGLTNTTWDADNYATGQAATEDQLKAVHDSAVKYDVDSNGNLNKNKITLEGTGGTKIGNVAAGEVSATSMDAVNGSQLYQVKQDINNINHDISKLGDEIDSVGALSAAMAGLHPRFQDGNKGELAMAYGGYGGKSALAVGGFYAPNEKVMFSLGMGISEGGSKMGNFGVNFALDRSPDRKKEHRIYTRTEVDTSLEAQDQKIQLLLAKIEEQSHEIELLKEKIQ